MTFIKRVLVFTIVALAVHGTALQAQVGKGLIDPNVASEQQLAGLPNMCGHDKLISIASHP